MLEVTDATFAAEVLGAGRPVIVDFWAPWCGPCAAVGKALEALEARHGERVAFATVNVDEHPLSAADHNVLSLPTVILFDAGTPQMTVVGARSQSHFEQQFASWLD